MLPRLATALFLLISLACASGTKTEEEEPAAPPPEAPEAPEKLDLERFPELEAVGGGPCGEGSFGLAEAVRTTGVRQLVWDFQFDTTGGTQLASSTLVPSGKPAAAPDTAEHGEDLMHRRWGCKYAPGRLLDGDEKTAWVEGAQGNGIGEVVVVPLEVAKGVEVFAGYGKSEALYRANARPKTLRVSVLRIQKIDFADGTIEGAEIFQGLEPVGTTEVSLKDHFGWQPLPLTEAQKISDGHEGAGGRAMLALEILEVYPGSKYEDTAISELRAL